MVTTVPIAMPVIWTEEKNKGWNSAILMAARIVAGHGIVRTDSFLATITNNSKEKPPIAKRKAPIDSGWTAP